MMDAASRKKEFAEAYKALIARGDFLETVSYTHLTLPTKRIV